MDARTTNACAALTADEERSAALAERRRLGRDLHDSVSPALFALHARAQVVERALAAGDTGLLAEAAEIEHCLMCTYLYAAFSLK